MIVVQASERAVVTKEVSPIFLSLSFRAFVSILLARLKTLSLSLSLRKTKRATETLNPKTINRSAVRSN